MRHLAAYLLLVAGGNAAPTAEQVTTLLGEAGIEVETERLTQMLGELEGKDIGEIIADGKLKLMAAGASSGPAPAAAAGGAPAAAAAAAPEKPKEEEVDALAGGMDMFGGSEKTGDY
ncbi:60s acidic ribosomal protein-domain-containing protein [Ochromonadaceae sp. CCMP2298]|nr:60s acidic ribosomal protein-domain-containing protein [Ochromonadaceae sp. CCMP2298]|mmetsp:Transcript_9236/g.20404  ORF Transcript_9236/g.20404 Transcript_9236/m.20404 type:complete len:117 (+) Transcript_9236:87-437(+)|eukprot:CAMPEP_0173187212 /NCGR_PEP_ID=MMETSP1141-20130122/10575_1 /TAXON_ID=483371 /ORGANISM="non described non described, Strain CCMP2298" /LENGTH=116 /DNA_ID=CAMNT_0014111007 /DNA_START=47 /DNA_END=397 /DNA_ORIENTATION=+